MYPLRFSAKTVAIGFIGGSLLALTLFALSLTVAWVNLQGSQCSTGCARQTGAIEAVFWWGLAATAGVIFALGLFCYRLVRRALLTEITRIGQTTSAIISGDLSRRLPHNCQQGEMKLLATTVNQTLDQIETLIHAYRQVSDSIAHDLRTPLAELRFRLESLVLSKQPIEDIYNELDAAILDVDRVILIFNALLRLAEIDHGARRAGFEQVDLVKLVDDVADLYRPVAELNQIALTFDNSGSVQTVGDPLLLAQAVGNLIDNALKYTATRVNIEARHEPDSGLIVVAISDDGAGISDEDKPRVVERFYRGHTNHATDGVGLGLSLVVAVARLHGGSLELRDASPGLRAVLLLRPQHARPA